MRPSDVLDVLPSEVTMATTRVLGLLLIGLGGVLLLTLTTDLDGEVVLGFLGVAFLVAAARQRSYGFLIPGCLLAGLAVGLALENLGVSGEVVPLGLGAGFVAIAVVDRLVTPGRAAWWWPLIPGGILLATSLGAVTGVPALGRYLVPAALIVVGVVLLVRRGEDAPTRAEGARDGRGDTPTAEAEAGPQQRQLVPPPPPR